MTSFRVILSTFDKLSVNFVEGSPFVLNRYTVVLAPVKVQIAITPWSIGCQGRDGVLETVYLFALIKFTLFARCYPALID